MRKLKLTKLSQKELENEIMSRVKGGEITNCSCGCGCCAPGGSSSADNSMANDAEAEAEGGTRYSPC